MAMGYWGDMGILWGDMWSNPHSGIGRCRSPAAPWCSCTGSGRQRGGQGGYGGIRGSGGREVQGSTGVLGGIIRVLGVNTVEVWGSYMGPGGSLGSYVWIMEVIMEVYRKGERREEYMAV